MRMFPVNYRITEKLVTAAQMLKAAPSNLFVVTGEVEMTVFAKIEQAVTSDGALTLEVGIAGQTTVFLAQKGKAVLLADKVWVNVANPGTLTAFPWTTYLASGITVIQTTGTADATAGQIRYYCLWRPVSAGAKVAAA